MRLVERPSVGLRASGLAVTDAAIVCMLLLLVPPVIAGVGAQLGLGVASVAAVVTLAQLPLVIGAVLSARQHGPPPAPEVDLVDRRDLAARVERAETALAQAQDRNHELRSTLSSLRLSHQLLGDGRAAIAGATRRRLHSLHTVELERAERLLAQRPMDLVTTVALDEVLDPLVQVMALQGCAVRWRANGSRVQGRADGITEIVHILLDNAARHAAGRDVSVKVTTCGRWVDLRVQDGGPGVPPDFAPVVFDRGARGARSQGEGIGLHAARRLAHELSGHLWLEPPSPGGGAEFVLRLPVASGRARCLAPAA